MGEDAVTTGTLAAQGAGGPADSDQPAVTSGPELGPEPLLSIVVPVYNHERYIERCLRGIAMQKCSYPYEVLIGEDCSPDGSRAVLRCLEVELPACFHFFYREHNMGDMGNGNSSDLLNRCRGKYLAICEGDDFWTFDGKLQAQLDFLESHPDYVATYHHCTVVGEDSEPNGEKYPDCLSEEYTLDEFYLRTMPGQTATLIARREPYAEAKRRFLEHRLYESYPSDVRNSFLLLSCGRVRVFQGAWSAYRHVVKGGSSFSATSRVNERYARNEVLFYRSLVSYADALGRDDLSRAARRNLSRILLKWSVGSVRSERLGASLREVVSMPGWPANLLSIPRWYAVLGFRALRGRGVTM